MMVESRRRTANPYVENGKPLLAKVGHLNGDNLRRSVETAVDLLGGLDKAFRAGDRVLIKPNFNCAYALPLSTDLAFLAAAIEMLQDAGASVVVGESSGRAAGPTEGVIAALQVLPMLRRYGVSLVNFDHDEWIDMSVGGEYWDSFAVPRTIYEADKRLYLANMRTHSSARFSASLKLSVGWTNTAGRDFLHADPATTEVKIAELNLGWQPNLVLIDGRRSTVSWHGRGDYVFPNLVIASGDMVAADAEAVRILQGYPARNRLAMPLEQMGQFVGAEKHRLGSMEAVIREQPARTQTEEQGTIKDPAAQYYAERFQETTT